MEDSAEFCPTCGTANEPAAPYGAQQPAQQSGQPNSFQNMLNTPDATAEYDPNDIANNKMMAVFSYLGILLLIPWFAAPNSKFARFHAKQGLVLCIVDVGYIIISAILSAVIKVETSFWGVSYRTTPGWLTAILWLISLPIFALAILGIVNAVKGKAKQLPVIGKFIK